jgi:hypothetical protein
MKKLLLSLLSFCSIYSYAQVTNGLVAKYSFNNGNANDDVGNNHGVVYGATLTTDRFGNPDKAYSFNGINNYITFGDSSEFQFANNTFTLSFWIKYSDTQASFVIGKRNSSFYQYSFFIFDNPNSGLPDKNLYYFGMASNNMQSVLNGYDQSGNNYKHVVVVQTNDSALLYIDNALVNTNYANLSGGNLIAAGGSFIIGIREWGGNYPFKGEIDDIRIYNRAITVSEIDTLYNELNPCIFNPGITASGITLTASISGADYQWINCNNYTPIANATSQSFTPSTNGSYAVIVTQNNCTDTSNCITVTTVGINETADNMIKIFPNPTNNRLNIDLINDAEIGIYAITGKLMDKFAAKQNHIVDISAYPNGMYFVKTPNETIKFVKQ